MSIIQQTIKNLANHDNSEIGDYLDDEGFLICGKCKTRKQYEIELFGEIRKVPIMCKCKEEENRKEKLEIEKNRFQTNIEQLQRQGMTDLQYLEWTLEKDDNANPKISKIVQRYIEKWPEMKESNTGLMFFGNTGTGKTFCAACIANALIDKGISVLMTSLPSLLSSMNNGGFENGKQRVMEQIANKQLVIIDDLGVERGTDYSFEKVYEVIDTRYKSGKPLIITTNLTKQELENPTDIRNKRIYDRILEMCLPILVAGESRRTVNAAVKRKKAKELLGV